ncbi:MULTISPECIES: NUDIX hydrolase [unclassified Polynucleobacter]|jgi:8-oxo-dGTP pyrophosphatase MutT (NUDIX family)|uniref:NUDIX hydrolase n=1 Tax=unclassified Polynucleobacter TaxID=2640945 RepID=UPI001C0BBA79|nr:MULTISPECIES: NUDIX domain-containing protein [unclassified Polynucleobacter]MBU3549522.1 NUDIX domain-containing protein [Polynucleobacter sp. P1-05-14]MBU3638769.1 NUDIX domain-containing protein [Polynucleobacter sp. AP-RePozz3-80-G7]
MNIFSEIAIQGRKTIHHVQCDAVLKSSNPFSRSTTQGHITASGLVIKDDKVLLIFHPYIKRWFQPGGHIDEGDSPIEAAIREVYEETGYICELDANSQEPIDIDIHEIPENSKKGEGAHLHIDLLYRLRALRQEQSAEDIECKWFAFSEVESIRIQRALAKLA